jgi:hypothetical protein
VLATPEMPGAFEAIAALTSQFGGRVWLVSKCGPETQRRTLRWLYVMTSTDVRASIRPCAVLPGAGGEATARRGA